MKFLILSILIASKVIASDFYFTQSGSGGHIGSKDAPWSVADLSKSSVSILPGDALHVVGVISTPMVFRWSGAAGKPARMVFDQDAKFSRATWAEGSNIISLGASSYIEIDGGKNGAIEATANGEFLANKNHFYAIYSSNGSNVTIKNLTIRNLYVRKYGDTGIKCDGIFFSNWQGNTTVDNCIITYCFFGVWGGYNSGKTGFTVSNSRLLNCAQSIVFGDNNKDQTASVVRIFGNTIDGNSAWYDAADVAHADGVHLQAVNGGASNLSDVQIYGNTFGADVSDHMTAQVYMDGAISKWSITGNVFSQGPKQCSNGAIYAKSFTDGGTITGNSFKSSGVGNAINLIQSPTNYQITNNSFIGWQWATYWEPNNNPSYTSDFNTFQNAPHMTKEGGGTPIPPPVVVPPPVVTPPANATINVTVKLVIDPVSNSVLSVSATTQ